MGLSLFMPRRHSFPRQASASVSVARRSGFADLGAVGHLGVSASACRLSLSRFAVRPASAKRQRLPALSRRVSGAAAPLKASLFQRPAHALHQGPAFLYPCVISTETQFLRSNTSFNPTAPSCALGPLRFATAAG